MVVIESTAGSTFKNSSGSTTLKARLYRKGEELDADGTSKAYTYKWSRRDKNGTLDATLAVKVINIKSVSLLQSQQAMLVTKLHSSVRYLNKEV